MRRNAAFHCKTCHFCQITGKPKEAIPHFPFVKVPHIPEPFSCILCDIMSLLPKTSKGSEFIFTLLNTSTTYLHAVPPRKITAKMLVSILLKFSLILVYPIVYKLTVPHILKAFKEAMAELGTGHRVSSPYYPQTQGAVERAHPTMKSIPRKYAA